METGSILSAVFGGFFVVLGLLMIFFHGQFEEIHESYRRAFPEFINRYWPRGKLLTIFAIVFGALSFLGGIAVLIVNFLEP